MFGSVKKIQTYKDVLKAFKNYKIYSNEKNVRVLNVSFGIILKEAINFVYKNQDKFKNHKKLEYFMENGIKYKFLVMSEYAQWEMKMNKYLKAYKFNQKQIIKYIKVMVKSLAVNDTDYLEYKNILFEIEQNVAFKNESHYQYLLSKVEHWDKKIYFFLKESKKLWDWGIGC